MAILEETHQCLHWWICDAEAGTWGYLQAADEILDQVKDQGFSRVAVVSDMSTRRKLCEDVNILLVRNMLFALVQSR